MQYTNKKRQNESRTISWVINIFDKPTYNVINNISSVVDSL